MLLVLDFQRREHGANCAATVAPVGFIFAPQLSRGAGNLAVSEGLHRAFSFSAAASGRHRVEFQTINFDTLGSVGEHSVRRVAGRF